MQGHIYDSNVSIEDQRELLVNDRRCGTAPQIAVRVDEVTSIHGLLIDIDCPLLNPQVVGEKATQCSLTLFRTHVSQWLARDPVLAKAEVRATSPLGLHVLLRLDEPILCTAKEAVIWDGVVKGLRCVLPGDPRVNGINAMTRPIGAENTKHSPPQTVTLLKDGGATTKDEVLDLARRVCSEPAKLWLRVLYGTERVKPCPLCAMGGSSLGIAGKQRLKCYKCGPHYAEKIHYHFYDKADKDERSEEVGHDSDN